MRDPTPDLQWAPRLRPDKRRRLYELDARGIVGDDLVDDVAWTLYARCQSILEVAEAARGRVACPQRRLVIRRQAGAEREEVIAGGARGWSGCGPSDGGLGERGDWLVLVCAHSLELAGQRAGLKERRHG